MNRVLPMMLLPVTALLMTGCVTDAVRSIDAFNNVRSGYQAYQGVQGIKDMEKAKPVMKDSDVLYVKADLKPSEGIEALNQKAAERICGAFMREFEAMKAEGLNRGRELSCVASGDTPDKAVVLNLREQIESSTVMRVIQSNTIKSESSWVARATGEVLDAQANPGFKSHDELIAYVGNSLSMQILRSLAPAQNEPEYEQWAKKVEAWSKERSKG